jgi:hypothetical protein
VFRRCCLSPLRTICSLQFSGPLSILRCRSFRMPQGVRQAAASSRSSQRQISCLKDLQMSLALYPARHGVFVSSLVLVRHSRSFEDHYSSASCCKRGTRSSPGGIAENCNPGNERSAKSLITSSFNSEGLSPEKAASLTATLTPGLSEDLSNSRTSCFVGGTRSGFYNCTKHGPIFFHTFSHVSPLDQSPCPVISLRSLRQNP